VKIGKELKRWRESLYQLIFEVIRQFAMGDWTWINGLLEAATGQDEPTTKGDLTEKSRNKVKKYKD